MCVCHSNIFTTVGRIADILFKQSWSPEDKCPNNFGIAIQLYTDIYIFQGINTAQMFLLVLVCLTFLFLLKHYNSWMDCHEFLNKES